MAQKCLTGAACERVFLPVEEQENLSDGLALEVSLPRTCHMPKGIGETRLHLLSQD